MEDLKKLKKMAFMGALAVESARVIPHAGDAGFLTGTSVPGFVGLGVASKVSDVSYDVMKGKKKRKKKRR